jgi:hypothetical protein
MLTKKLPEISIVCWIFFRSKLQNSGGLTNKFAEKLEETKIM